MRQQIEIPARSTSGVNNINSEEVRQLNLLLPPIKEQEETIRRAAKYLALADRIDEQYQGAKKQVDLGSIDPRQGFPWRVGPH